MKNEELNLAELLKDCPVGTKLYSTVCGEVEFVEVTKDSSIFPIITRDSNSIKQVFTKKGCYIDSGFAECVLFPSKEQRDWSKYQRPLKDGDIIYDRLLKKICIYSLYGDKTPCIKGCRYNESFIQLKFEKLEGLIPISIQDYRLASEEEKHKLFHAIKNEGYQWNTETKTLEKLIVPKFKVGDKIRHKTTNKDDIYEISKVYDDSYGLVGFTWMIYMKYQDNYELVPNKFDISTLKPFDKVLCRHSAKDKWKAHFFSHINTGYREYPFYATFAYRYCIPYNSETKHLVGTTEEAPEFYINWEEE